ncbi:hypothetical protein BOTU111922_02935 [Bordetella tumulicola]
MSFNRDLAALPLVTRGAPRVSGQSEDRYSFEPHRND